jgi:hypothetical protein
MALLQDSSGVADGCREVRRLRRVVAADVRRGETGSHRLPLAPQHTGKNVADRPRGQNINKL